MNILDAHFSAGSAGFFFDDQRAIKDGAERDGFSYRGTPVTDGFRAIRQAGQSISIMLKLENGDVAVGDAAAIQYSGAGGREPLFLPEDYLPRLREQIGPALTGREVSSYREMESFLDWWEKRHGRIHTALRYGLSQAVLGAVARATGQLRTEVLCDEYGLPPVADPVPIFGQSGDRRYRNAEKMILKRADVLPHGLFNNVEEKIGRNGDKLRDYLKWLVNRIRELRPTDAYQPDLHVDVYGNFGSMFDLDPARMVDYLSSLDEVTGEFPLYVEGPVDMEERDAQIEVLRSLKERLDQGDVGVRIVADEWCNSLEDIRDFVDAGCCHMIQVKTPVLGSLSNTIEANLYCRDNGVGCYQGGTCNETDVSARCCVHVALATRPDRMLAKPGMGFDEGFTIVNNEMRRTLALLEDS